MVYQVDHWGINQSERHDETLAHEALAALLLELRESIGAQEARDCRNHRRNDLGEGQGLPNDDGVVDLHVDLRAV